jgi:hypothetical protein
MRCGVCHARLTVKGHRIVDELRGKRRVPIYQPCPRLNDPASHPARFKGTVTAETITDEQILALGSHPLSSLNTKAWCIAAMRVTYDTSPKQLAERAEARARCAAILNASKR